MQKGRPRFPLSYDGPVVLDCRRVVVLKKPKFRNSFDSRFLSTGTGVQFQEGLLLKLIFFKEIPSICRVVNYLNARGSYHPCSDIIWGSLPNRWETFTVSREIYQTRTNTSRGEILKVEGVCKMGGKCRPPTNSELGRAHSQLFLMLSPVCSDDPVGLKISLSRSTITPISINTLTTS